MYRSRIVLTGAATLVACSIAFAGCGQMKTETGKSIGKSGTSMRQQSAQNQTGQPLPQQNGASQPRILSMTTDDAVDFRSDGSAALAVTTRDGKDYVQANQLLDTLEFQHDWNAAARRIRFGDNDAVFELKIDEKKARVDNRDRPLIEAPIMIGDKAYLPVSAADELLRDDITFSVRDQKFILHPTAKQTTRDRDATASGAGGQSSQQFGDDPNDPVHVKPVMSGNRSHAGSHTLSSVVPKAIARASFGAETLPAASTAKVSNLVDFAKRYLGVKYEFGADPYQESGTFDCSSFTRHVFEKYGVDLPRTARAQATKGQAVSKSSLRVGDVVFFSIPGRCRSNNTVGHVGIYLGNQKMIDADTKPKNGVQITDLTKPFWIDNYLSARRLL